MRRLANEHEEAVLVKPDGLHCDLEIESGCIIGLYSSSKKQDQDVRDQAAVSTAVIIFKPSSLVSGLARTMKNGGSDY
jgi:hypothetical protein